MQWIEIYPVDSAVQLGPHEQSCLTRIYYDLIFSSLVPCMSSLNNQTEPRGSKYEII